MRQGWMSPHGTLIISLGLISCLAQANRSMAAENQTGIAKEAAPEGAPDASSDELDNDIDDGNEGFLDGDRSATERITNTGSVQVGAGFRKGFGPDLRVGYHLDENKIVEGRFARFKGDDIAGFKDFEIDTLLIEGKFFMGNSLFMGIAGGWSQFRVEDEEILSLGTDSLPFSYKGKVDQFLLALSMGNQWQFESWTLGLDWLNLFMPFTASKVDSEGDFAMNGGELRRLNNEQNLKAEAWEVDYGLSFYVGYTW